MPFPRDISGACLDEETAAEFVQGHLSAAGVHRTTEHLEGCPSCRRRVDELLKAVRERSTLPASIPNALTRFAEGDLLAGRYRIARFIARGGMGEVYEAEDLILSTRVALKTLTAAISDDQQALARLKLEVKLARRITHPNVCRIFDLGVHEAGRGQDGAPLLFITMELVPGASMGYRLRTRGCMSTTEAMPIVREMIAGLGAAHREGIIHRDFKSDNVMLAPTDKGSPRVVVMDFGLARLSLPVVGGGSAADSRAVVGTVDYMAPEQIQGRPTLPASDIYGLGVVMFEMLSGVLPFRGDSPLEVASRRLLEDPPALSKFVPGLDPLWEATVMRCLARDPMARFASVEEVLAALQPAPAIVMPAPVPSPAPRRRMTALAFGAALLLSGILMAARLTGRSPAAAGMASQTSTPQPVHVVRPVADSALSSQTESEVASTSFPSPPLAPPPTRHRQHGRALPGPASTSHSLRSPLGSTEATPTPPPARRRSIDPEDGFIFR